MTCNNCKNHVSDGTRRCPFCGCNPSLTASVLNNDKQERTTFNGLGPMMSESNATPGGFGKNFGVEVAAKNKFEESKKKKMDFIKFIPILVAIAIIVIAILLAL